MTALTAALALVAVAIFAVHFFPKGGARTGAPVTP